MDEKSFLIQYKTVHSQPVRQKSHLFRVKVGREDNFLSSVPGLARVDFEGSVVAAKTVAEVADHLGPTLQDFLFFVAAATVK